MADPDPNAPASENIYDQMFSHGLGSESAGIAPAAPAEPPNPFDEMFRLDGGGQQQPETSTSAAVGLHAGLGAAPMVGGLIGAGRGVGIGGAIGAALFGAARGAGVGAAAGAAIPGLGEVGIGELGGGIVGGLIGGLIGGFGGAWATGKAQDYAIKQLPDTWRDPLEREIATTEKEHPMASFMGGLIPMAVTMTPFPKGLPANATTMERIRAYPVTRALLGGVIQGGAELGQEALSGEPLDWRKAAWATGFGLVFNTPNALGTRIESIGARARPAQVAPIEPARPVPEVQPERQSPDVGEFGDLYDAMFPRGEPAVKPAPVHEDAILGLEAPTIYGAWGSRVAGPQVTEEVFHGSQEMDPQTKMIAEDRERNETAVYKPPPAPDVGVVARTMNPELFDEHAEALARRDTLQRHADELGDGPGSETAKTRLAEADRQVDQTGEQVAAAHRAAAEATGNIPVREEGVQAAPVAAGDALPLKGAEAIEAAKALPPPEPGYVRFYHGGHDPTSGGGRWVTTDPKYAANWNGGSDLHYVDLPKNAPEVEKAQNWETGLEASYGASQVGTYAHFETSPEQAKGFKPVTGKKATSLDEQRQFIQQDMERRLIAAGRPLDVARADATIDAESYVARSLAMQGKIGSPAELYLTRGDVIRTEDGKSFPQGKPPWIKGKNTPPAKTEVPAAPAIDPAMAKAKADSLGIAKLIDRLKKQGASAQEISDVVSRKMTPDEIEAVPEIAASVTQPAPELAQTALPVETEAAQPVAAAYEAQEKISNLTPSEQRRELPKFTHEADSAIAPAPSGQLKPAGVYMFDPVELGVDANRFQFKSGGDQYGVTGALRSVSKWDAAKAQAIMVWEDLAGKLWVADGHQRAGLARRLTEQGKAKDIQLPGILYREADGVSADDIRAIAAVTNIANGSGSAIDGAKILRARPELMDGSVPLSAGKGQQAAALAHLGDEPFRMVVNEVIPEHFGAIVGEMIPNDHARQEAAIKAIARFEPRNSDEAAALTQRVAQAELAKGEEARQTSMFADLETPESTAGEEMKIVGSAIKRLKGDKALFSRVIANAERIEQTGSHIERETAKSVVGETDIFAKSLSSDAYSSGPVREVLIQTARELKNGTISIGDASARVLASIRARIEEGGLGGAGARGRAEEPAQAQPETEQGPEGTRQELIPGVSPVTDRARIEAAAAKPLRGGNTDLQHDGLFGDAKDQRELFQDANAKVRIREGQRPKLTLMRSQNASTYLHERSHVYLANLLEDAAHPEVPAPVRVDAETARKWLGMKADQATPTTKQHERWARTFEQYLREGVAPSARLANVFAKMKNWLLDIYKSLKDLWGEDKFEENVSPNIRSVFDRLLSAEAQGRGTIVTPSVERGKTLADIHEQDAAEITNPFERGAAAMRVDAEAAQHDADIPPEIAHEIQTASAEVDAEQEQAGGEGIRPGAGEGADAARGAGNGPGERGAVGEDRGQPEPQPERGRVGVQPSEELSGKREPVGGSERGSEQRSGDGEATRPGQPPVPRPSATLDRDTPLVDKAGNIRIENLTTREDVAQAIRAAAEANDGFIGDRNGPVTDAQVDDLAIALGMDADMISRRKIGQAFNAVQIIAARRLLIQSATDVADKMRVAARGTDEDLMAYAVAKDRHQMIQAQIAGITAEAGRALRAFRNISGSSVEEKRAMAVDQFIKKATGKTLYQLREEAKLGSALDTPEKVSKMMADARKPNFSDKVLEYWINGLISGLWSHVTNSIGNLVLAATKIGPEPAVAAILGAAKHAAGRPGEYVRPGEVGARMSGWVKGLPGAFQASAEAFNKGATVHLPGERGSAIMAFQPHAGLASRPELNLGATYADAAGAAFANLRGMRDGLFAGAALLRAGGIEGEPTFGTRYSPLGVIADRTYRGVNVAPLGTLARLPSRFMASVEAFFRSTNFSVEKSARAYRQAVAEGRVGADFDRRVAEIWQNPNDQVMNQASAREAIETSLMGQGGQFTQALAKLTNARVFGIKLGKFIDPFVRISGNIIEQTIVQRTPLGLLAPEIREQLMSKDNIIRDMAQARMLVGTALSVTFGGLAASSFASGSGPSDPRKAAMWRLAGNQAHSVRIGDMWYDVHRLGPMGMLMSVAADMYDVAHAAADGDMLLAGATLQHAITQNILDESFMRGPADLIKAMEDPGRYGEAYLRNWASSFVPYSVGMAQLARRLDPYTRQARTVMDAIKMKIPGESETLFPRRDVWGEPMPNMDGFGGVTSIYERRMSTDPVNLSLLSLGIAPSSLERKIRNVQLDDNQYDDFQRLAGRMTKQRLDIIVNSADFQSWPSHVQHDVITETIRQSREAARGVLMMKYPQIIREAMDAKRARFMGEWQ